MSERPTREQTKIAGDASIEIEPLLNEMSDIAEGLPITGPEPEEVMQASVTLKALLIRVRSLNSAIMSILTDQPVRAEFEIKLRERVDRG